ncbi:MAG: PEP-CTERM-box response regulator transcription factor [Alphaproteobacteria bacterium]
MSEAPRLLIVEDDPGIQRQLRWTFETYAVLTASDREGALACVRSKRPPVVTLDLGLPPDPDGAAEGLATLSAILASAPETKVIVVTGNEDRENAVRAIGLGAYDFYQKPIDAEILALIVERAFRLHQLEDENRRLMASEASSPLHGIIAASSQMLKVCRMVEKVAGSDVGVLFLGESGTGKEILARALHDLSARRKGPFVAINCAAIPETLLESELFGYEKGAFTGAVKQTLGKVETAQGGTLFLDEIGDLPLSLQVKLLRFLQDKIIERIGGRRELPVDVRVVCATNQNLSELIGAGRFREDLYYRLTEIVVDIPPLRDRDGDAVLVAKYLLHKFSRAHGRNIRGFSDEAVAAIAHYPWPGNVRELENRIKRAVIMAEGRRLTPADLGFAAEETVAALTLKDVREDAERRAIRQAFSQVDGNISKAAKILGISRPTLYNLMREYGIEE